jgi:Protein of unknown function (DUF2752)
LIRNPHQQRKRIANVLLASTALACVALLLYPPVSSSFYPACPIREFLGIDCPGCGATRALAALLRGHILEALRLNALFVLLLPFVVAGAIKTYRSAIRPGSFRSPSPPAPALYAALAATTIFTIARNLQ